MDKLSAAQVGVYPAYDKKQKFKNYDEGSDAYIDVGEPNPFMLSRPKGCWVCGGWMRGQSRSTKSSTRKTSISRCCKT
ncbi:hypothetical protein F5B17DRAFT_390895 [Nemania serpens]|nr:hypothetical protein F5B17DRAFT_390895 [Nemania serpens]